MVSIIAAVYNVEKYIDECVDSVLKQSYTDFELILVDDCSPDSSPEKCDAYSKSDNRVKVIHKPCNEGLGMARNTGLDMASGEYVLFVDSDDTLERDLLEKTVPVMESGCDLAVFGINRNYEDKDGNITKSEKLETETVCANGDEEIVSLFTKLNDARMFQYAWNKLYRRDFLIKTGVRFESTKLIEDFLFNIALFCKAEKINTVKDCLYNYRKPSHETLASKYAPEFFELVKRKYTLEKEFVKSRNGQTQENMYGVYNSHMKHIIQVFVRDRGAKILTRSERKSKMRTVLNDALTLELCRNFKPHGIKNKAVMFAISHKSVMLCSLISCTADVLKTKFKTAF